MNKLTNVTMLVLGAAERKLAGADVKVSACTDLEGALRRRYKL